MAATLIIGDKTFNIDVAEIEFRTEDEYRDSMYSLSQSPHVAMQSVELTGKIVSVSTTDDLLNILKATNEETLKSEDTNMSYEKTCSSEESLTKQIIYAELDEDKKLLMRHNVIRQDGTITETGKDLLMNMLLGEYKEEVVAKVRILDEDAE